MTDNPITPEPIKMSEIAKLVIDFINRVSMGQTIRNTNAPYPFGMGPLGNIGPIINDRVEGDMTVEALFSLCAAFGPIQETPSPVPEFIPPPLEQMPTVDINALVKAVPRPKKIIKTANRPGKK